MTKDEIENKLSRFSLTNKTIAQISKGINDGLDETTAHKLAIIFLAEDNEILEQMCSLLKEQVRLNKENARMEHDRAERIKVAADQVIKALSGG
jgi:hypothetical protein